MVEHVDTIVLEVEGGVVHLVKGIPPGVEVEIRDYDTEGCSRAEEKALPEDEDGRKYFCTLWTYDDAPAPDCPGQMFMFPDD